MKKIIDLIISYKFHLLILFFYEFLHILLGYKGNNINIRNNNKTTDTIPCPYFFLNKILKNIKALDIKSLTDIGCGNGRVIYFFKKHININYFGFEIHDDAFKRSSEIFINDPKVSINKEDFFQVSHKIEVSDCYFINDPIKEIDLHTDLFGKMVENHQSLNKKIYYIIVNLNIDKTKIFKKCILLKSYSIGERGYKIYCTK